MMMGTDFLTIENMFSLVWYGYFGLDLFYEGDYSHLMRSGAKYVMIRSAPARLMANIDSSAASFRSRRSCEAAAQSMLYSPETW